MKVPNNIGIITPVKNENGTFKYCKCGRIRRLVFGQEVCSCEQPQTYSDQLEQVEKQLGYR